MLYFCCDYSKLRVWWLGGVHRLLLGVGLAKGRFHDAGELVSIIYLGS